MRAREEEIRHLFDFNPSASILERKFNVFHDNAKMIGEYGMKFVVTTTCHFLRENTYTLTMEN